MANNYNSTIYSITVETMDTIVDAFSNNLVYCDESPQILCQSPSHLPAAAARLAEVSFRQLLTEVEPPISPSSSWPTVKRVVNPALFPILQVQALKIGICVTSEHRTLLAFKETVELGGFVGHLFEVRNLDIGVGIAL